MVRGLKVSSEFKLEAVSAPGTTLASPGHVFIEIQIFKQIVRSEYCYPLFPILLHSKLSVSKIFPNCVDPGKLAETMSTQVVYIRLMQETALGDQILAQHCENAREFLFPTPKLSPSYPGIDREIVLERTNHYNGLLEPKIEFSSKTTIKEVKARLKNASTDHVPVKESKRDLSPTRSRGRFEMSMTDDRMTRKTAQNLSRAIASQRRPRSPKRKAVDPPYMDSTISFRAKSPVRKTRSKKKTKKLPFLTGTDDNNMTHYTQQYLKDKKEDEILAQEIREDLTTYEQIRHRITKLLQSEKAKEINRDGELTAALARIEGKIDDSLLVE